MEMWTNSLWRLKTLIWKLPRMPPKVCYHRYDSILLARTCPIRIERNSRLRMMHWKICHTTQNSMISKTKRSLLLWRTQPKGTLCQAIHYYGTRKKGNWPVSQNLGLTVWPIRNSRTHRWGTSDNRCCQRRISSKSKTSTWGYTIAWELLQNKKRLSCVSLIQKRSCQNQNTCLKRKMSM